MITAEGFENDLCYRIAIQANNLGYQGKRVLEVRINLPQTGSDNPIPTFTFIIDNEPLTGSTVWEDR